VRRGGLDLSLTLIAHRDDPEYGGRIAALAATRPWFRILSDLSREQLAHEVAQHRYGLHTMENEHFGIAVAEMLRAGCIPFVHDSGGPVEIVGGRGELHFQDAAGGAQALAAAMRDPARQEGLRRSLAERRNLFSAEEFCSTLRRLAGEFSVDPKESVM